MHHILRRSLPLARPFLGIRFLATEAAQPPTPIFQKSLTAEEAAHAYATVKRSNRGNPVDARRMYWYHVYSQVVKARYVFVLQNTNIPAATLVQLKKDLRKTNLEMLSVRNGIFQAACRDNGLDKMRNLFSGNTHVWFSNDSSPDLLKSTSKLMTKYKQHLFIVGGSLEGMVLTADSFNDIKNLPPKAVLYAQILGLISTPASSLAAALEQTPKLLVSSLQQHNKQMQDE